MKRAIGGIVIAVMLLGVAVSVIALTTAAQGPRGPRGKIVHTQPGKTVHTPQQPAAGSPRPQTVVTVIPAPRPTRSSHSPAPRPSHRPTHRPSPSPSPKPTCLLGVVCL